MLSCYRSKIRKPVFGGTLISRKLCHQLLSPKRKNSAWPLANPWSFRTRGEKASRTEQMCSLIKLKCTVRWPLETHGFIFKVLGGFLFLFLRNRAPFDRVCVAHQPVGRYCWSQKVFLTLLPPPQPNTLKSKWVLLTECSWHPQIISSATEHSTCPKVKLRG